MKKTATITKDGQYRRLVEPKFIISNKTIEILNDFIPNEEEACRIRSYIITIMLKLREGERDSDKSYDIIFYHLNELIDQILLDKGLKTVDKVVPF